uniref:Uncharacterized protein n=1 Tax=Trieres chinensis TaxID=1514140 RepID=A0A7S1YY72_TRICV|mmetsp:Transcript_13391/g.27645  ORF Transcript_13391/g.27645 Transcript_13391/m.27645 type:complete len:171 (+) Transcript_13391:258-770(+)
MITSRVTFKGTIKVCFVPSLREMTETEICSTWYSRAEFNHMKKESFATVKTMRTRKGRRLDDCRHCQRGLEHYKSLAHMEQKQINKDCVIAAVLQEQRAQMHKGIKNEEDIRAASCNYSRWAGRLAQEAASSDANYVKGLMKKQNHLHPRMTDNSSRRPSTEEKMHRLRV